jgi:hypothetical protein
MLQLLPSNIIPVTVLVADFMFQQQPKQNSNNAASSARGYGSKAFQKLHDGMMRAVGPCIVRTTLS